MTGIISHDIMCYGFSIGLSLLWYLMKRLIQSWISFGSIMKLIEPLAAMLQIAS